MSSVSTSSLKKSSLNTNKVITVGVGKDFELLHDAMRFCESLVFGGSGSLEIVLDDGVHVLSEATIKEEWCCYLFKDVNVEIRSASESKSLCTVIIDYNSVYEYLDVIFITGGTLSIRNISFDGYDANNIDIKRWFIYAYNGSSLYVKDCNFNHFYNPVYGSGSNIAIYGDVIITEAFSGVSVWNGTLVQWADNASGDITAFRNFYEYGEPTTNWVIAVLARGNSYFTSYSDIEVSGPPALDKIFNGFRIDESSRMYIDGTATHNISDCKVAIKIEGGSSIGTEQRDFTLNITDCDTGFQISYNSHLFLVNDPIFVNTPVEYTIPCNMETKEGSYVRINRVAFETENGFINNEDGTAEIKNSTPASIEAKGLKAIPTLEYLLSPEFGNSLPTTDPAVAGTLWNNNGVLSISTGRIV